MKKIKIAFCGLSGNDFVHKKFQELVGPDFELEISTDPDFVVSGCYSNEWKRYTNDELHRPVLIYYYEENVFPDFNHFDYAIGFQSIGFGDRHFYLPYHYERGSKYLLGKDNSELEDVLAQRKFCNFVYSNAKLGEGAKLRQDFCIELSKYKPVDCPGKVLNNMVDAIEPRYSDRINGKLAFIKDYKFTIAFENSCTDGYTTEKLTEPFRVNSVPIYWGNPSAVKYFNPKAFINANSFNSFDDLIKYIIELDSDDEKYMEMLRQPPMLIDKFPDYEKGLRDYLIGIFENPKRYVEYTMSWSPFSLRPYKVPRKVRGIKRLLKHLGL